jgi:hypothetical protein
MCGRLWVQSILQRGRSESCGWDVLCTSAVRHQGHGINVWKKNLRAKGFLQSEAEALLWLLRDKGGRILVMVYVDDGLVAARTIADADGLVRLVGPMFDI